MISFFYFYFFILDNNPGGAKARRKKKIVEYLVKGGSALFMGNCEKQYTALQEHVYHLSSPQGPRSERHSKQYICFAFFLLLHTVSWEANETVQSDATILCNYLGPVWRQNSLNVCVCVCVILDL